MKKAIEETERRRKIQLEYNRIHGITPKTVKKSKEEILRITEVADERILTKEEDDLEDKIEEILREKPRAKAVKELRKLMNFYAENLEFEKAMVIRDKLRELGEII
jgi:excinuclease ABC subunit B